MRFIDYIMLALRNIARQKLRSALTIFAVVIGATSVTIMLALVFGAKSFFLAQMNANGMMQQVAISQKADIENFDDADNGGGCSDCTKLTDDIVAKVQKVPHVVAVARELGAWNFEALNYGGKKLSLQQVLAYDEGEVKHDTLLAGRSFTDKDTEGVVILTADYADKFGFKGKYDQFIGKEVQIQSRKGYTGVGAEVPKPVQKPDGGMEWGRPDEMPATMLKAKVVGVIDTSSNNAMVRVPMAWARQMNVNRMWQVTEEAAKAAQAKCRAVRGPCNAQAEPVLVTEDFFNREGYNSLTAKVDDVKYAKQVASDIKKFGVGAADAESFIKQQMTIFNVIGLVLGGIGGIALAVAAVGVVNTMVMAILERTREIGVMRAVGARRSTIRRLFTFEAAVLGFLGGVVGVGIGYLLTLIANPIINDQLSSNGAGAKNIIGLPIWLIFAVVGTTTVIGMLAGLYPAMRAAKLDPVEALRYE